jgi:2-C-methyl-D-erythritol 4-phosphate cytidylyltransferase/2-C-methyl-D-erythritol 2,4-cyclodiphosphate synthase
MTPSSSEALGRAGGPVVAALIVAGGSGERAGAGLPKQYRFLAGERVLRRALRLFAVHPEIARVICAIRKQDTDLYQECAADLGSSLLSPAQGGATRQESVLAGLEALSRLARPPDIVLVHDAARPSATASLVSAAIRAAARHGAAIPGVPVVDTIKRVDEVGRIVETPPRAVLRAVQTPQAFAFDVLLEAHRRALASGMTGLTDDGAVVEWAGHAVHVFEGEAGNAKLTTAEDFLAAEDRLSPALEPLVGSGYDVHAFDPSREGPVMLAGVPVPHGAGIKAHSDGDVILHALTDAILGVLADGDIGVHFPPSDPQWRGASSDRFVAFAMERLRARGGRLANVDVTLVCEAPRVGPHRDAMRARLAELCGLPTGRVGLKATTSEKMGFTGRREGLAAHVVVSALLPAGDHA